MGAGGGDFTAPFICFPSVLLKYVHDFIYLFIFGCAKSLLLHGLFIVAAGEGSAPLVEHGLRCAQDG